MPRELSPMDTHCEFFVKYFTLKKERDNMLGIKRLEEGIFCDRSKKCYKKVWKSNSRR